MDELIVTRQAHIALVELNRPERRNALNPPLMKKLAAAFLELSDDSDVKVVVLTGRGGAFCSGGDIRAADDVSSLDKPTLSKKDKSFAASVHWLRSRMEAARILHLMPKPTIAMIGGAAAGAGLSLAGACDLRIASDKAVFVSAFANVGGSGDYGGSYFWTQILGTAKARELYFLSEKMSAAQALQFGLVNRVVADDALLSETMGIAEKLANRPGEANAYIKANLNAAQNGSLESLFDLEATNMTLSVAAAKAAFGTTR